MTSETHAHTPTNLDLFREKVTGARRQTGRLQRELADALGINAQVLSRKLHGVKQTFPTHAEVKQIIKTLATLGNIKLQVDEVTWEMWWAEGKALSQEEVSTLALTAITEIQRS